MPSKYGRAYKVLVSRQVSHHIACRRQTNNGDDQMSGSTTMPATSIVLVHGGFVDGSGWQGVYNILKKDGYNVSIVQNPTTSLADDVVATKRLIAAQSGPVILVGHSYGGA